MVEYNKFLGKSARMIEINGALMNITDNVLRYNGFLSSDIYTNHTDSVKAVYSGGIATFPYEPYLH